ncbi:hypothetical protein [Pandoraea sputorum]|uniref:Secreted effector protein SseD n=1 Tax=Pandoraea sputorum TaxID=93222 RepID=A0A5E5BNV4_9BURK|nr:hypothetical protein [Pandoraea sputorum]VVE85990.1 Secreted effector protein SseD [Pandoraea sputorum]
MTLATDPSRRLHAAPQSPAQALPEAKPTAAAPASRIGLNGVDELGYGGSDAEPPSYGETMMKLALIRDRLRDTSRAYQQIEQLYGGQLRVEEVQLKLDAAQEGFKGKNLEAWTKLGGGLLTAGGALAGTLVGNGQIGSEIGRGTGAGAEALGSLAANPHYLGEQQRNAAAEYYRQLSDTYNRCASDAFEGAKSASERGNGNLQAFVQAVAEINRAATAR